MFNGLLTAIDILFVYDGVARQICYRIGCNWQWVTTCMRIASTAECVTPIRVA